MTTIQSLKSLLLLACLEIVSADDAGKEDKGYIGYIIWWWTEHLSFSAKFLICAISFLIFAGFTGLDGGQPMPKLPEVKLEDASDENDPKVFFEIDIGGERAGRIEMVLFKKVAPKTVENFRCLCTGEKGKGVGGKPLHYKNCGFHRIIPGEFIIFGSQYVHW